MRMPDDPWQRLAGRAPAAQPAAFGVCRRATALSLLLLCGSTLTLGADDPVMLTRRYHSGRGIVYVTKVHSHSIVDSHPPDLKEFLPPMPGELWLDQQCTVTVAKVHADGAADIQHRFDKFNVRADLAALPEETRNSVAQAQAEVSQQVIGQTLTAHYDRAGRLVDFEGGDTLFAGVDAPVREPLTQMLRMFLEQMGGQSLYPDHPVRAGDEWSQDLNAEPLKDYPFEVKGKGTLHYAGKTRYQGINAAIVEYHFDNVLTPAAGRLSDNRATPQLEQMGNHLDVQISGNGQGRILVALDDGRVLQNHSTLHQTLTARMQSKEGLTAPDDSPRMEIQATTEMEVDGNRSQ